MRIVKKRRSEPRKAAWPRSKMAQNHEKSNDFSTFHVSFFKMKQQKGFIDPFGAKPQMAPKRNVKNRPNGSTFENFTAFWPFRRAVLAKKPPAAPHTRHARTRAHERTIGPGGPHTLTPVTVRGGARQAPGGARTGFGTGSHPPLWTLPLGPGGKKMKKFF